MKAKVKDTGDKECGWRADLWGKYYYFDEFLNVKFTWEKNIEVVISAGVWETTLSQWTRQRPHS